MHLFLIKNYFARESAKVKRYIFLCYYPLLSSLCALDFSDILPNKLGKKIFLFVVGVHLKNILSSSVFSAKIWSTVMSICNHKLSNLYGLGSIEKTQFLWESVKKTISYNFFYERKKTLVLKKKYKCQYSMQLSGKFNGYPCKNITKYVCIFFPFRTFGIFSSPPPPSLRTVP